MTKKLIRTISTLLVIAFLTSMLPALALEDVPAQSKVEGYETYEPSPETASIYKYFKIYEVATGAALAEGSIGNASEYKMPMIPDGRLFGFEFLVEQTQETRLELLDENGVYLGLIACGVAEGQWGILEGAQWYSPDDGGEEKPIANFLAPWNGMYWSLTQQEFLYPGQHASS